MGEVILVSKNPVIPSFNVKIKKETTSRFTKKRGYASFDVIVDLLNKGDILIVNISFKESEIYIEENYKAIRTKIDKLVLVKDILDSLKYNNVDIPDIVDLETIKKAENFAYLFLCAIMDLETNIIKNNIHISEYILIIKKITEIYIASNSGDIAPTTITYSPRDEFQITCTSLLYFCLFHIVKD